MVAILSTLALGFVGVFLGFQLVSAVSIVASWISLAAGVAIGLGLTYFLFTDGYLSEFFDIEEIELFTSILIGVVSGFIGYRLIEGLLALFGLSIALIVTLLVVLSIYFSPAFVAGGISTGITLLAQALQELGGDN